MPAVSFDTTDLVIIVGSEAGLISEVDVPRIYSEWKEWMKTGGGADNPRFPPAFALSVGGNPLDATTDLDAYIFLRNDLGWRIRPDERSHQLIVNGNLFGADVLVPVFTPTLGAYTVDIRLVLSSKSLVRSTGVSGLTPTESAALIQAAADAAAARVAQEHFQKMADGARISDPGTGKIRVIVPGGDPMDPGDIYKEAEAYEDAALTQAYRGQGIQGVLEFHDP